MKKKKISPHKVFVKKLGGRQLRALSKTELYRKRKQHNNVSQFLLLISGCKLLKPRFYYHQWAE